MQNSYKSFVINDVFAIHENPDKIEWQYFREGVEIHPLYADKSGCSAALLKYKEGTSVPAHEHTGYEHILILHGDQSDDRQRYKQGDLVISPPGSMHTIKSTRGCIVLAIWEKPVKFL